MLGITSPVNSNVRVFKSVQSNPIVKNNPVSFNGNNIELEGPSKDTFVSSSSALSAKSKIGSLSAKEKEVLAENLAKAGYSAFEAGNYQACISTLDKSLELNPNNARGYHTKASAEKELGLFAQAIENYTKAIQLRPDSANSLRLLALTKEKYAKELETSDELAAKSVRLSAVGDYVKYISLMQKSTSSAAPIKTADAHCRKAEILMGEKSFESAIDDYNNAIEIYSSQLEQEPSNAKLKVKIGEAYHKKARCYQLLSKSPFSNEAEEAVQNYTKAIEYIPNSANTYFRRAQLNKKLNTEAAVDDLKRAIDLAPKRYQYWQALGEIMTLSDNPAEREVGFEFLAKATQLKMNK